MRNKNNTKIHILGTVDKHYWTENLIQRKHLLKAENQTIQQMYFAFN